MSPSSCRPLTGRPVRLLTLGELRRAWADLPDDAPVVVCSFLGEQHDERHCHQAGEHFPSAVARVVDLYHGRIWLPLGARDPEVTGAPVRAALLIPRGAA